MPESFEASIAKWRSTNDAAMEAHSYLDIYLAARQALDAAGRGEMPEDNTMVYLAANEIMAALCKSAFNLMACSEALPSYLTGEIETASREHIALTIKAPRGEPDSDSDIYGDLKDRVDLAAVAMRLGIWYNIPLW